MPIYEYVCEACGQLTEHLQKVNDPPPTACPACGANRLAKRMSRTSFHLKGGGWYADLYSSKGGAKKEADGKKEAETTKPAEAKPQPTSSGTEKPASPSPPSASPKGST